MVGKPWYLLGVGANFSLDRNRFFVFGAKARLFFYRVDALGSMPSVIRVLAAEWIPDRLLRLVRN
ncbi:TPA: hypothetical protein I7704_15570, partial [Vibrio vulnificus]|nr:hypothetical protein [Vibrio vulnificus]